jgi:GNAT superfamily N-acetyltransferase
VEALVCAREWTCVSFTALLATRSWEMLYVRDSGHAVLEAVLLGPHGLLLPVLDPRAPTFPEALPRRLPLALTVMGTEESVRAAERSLGRPPTRSVGYYLMHLPLAGWTDPREPPGPGPLVRRATAADLTALYPLQRDYEKEEVLLDPDMHDPRLCRLHLKRTLREQVVYLAEIGGRPVAKAGTNARGYGYDQIGGVFTCDEHRGKGHGRAVMAALLRHVAAEKTGACLFVKPENNRAVSLYRNLGFLHSGGFRISYYLH